MAFSKIALSFLALLALGTLGVNAQSNCEDPSTCGGASSDANGALCWCDELCTFYNDCCEDACLDCPDIVPCPSEVPNCGDPSSCGLISADENGFTCYCDALCTFFNDCCVDACSACGFCPAPPPPPFPPGGKLFGCAAGCGDEAFDEAGGLCYCDSLCIQAGDCCDDSCEFCGWCPPEAIDPDAVICGPGELKLNVLIEVLDPWPEEVSWEVDQLNTFATEYATLIQGDATGGAFCVSPTSPAAPYFVIIRDSYGDAFTGNIMIEVGGAVVEAQGLEALADGFQATWKLEVSPALAAVLTKQDMLPCQQQLDCLGSCYGKFYEIWTQDEICDDGQSGTSDMVNWDLTTPNITGLVFNCAAYGDDSGVCDFPYSPVVVPDPFLVFPLNEGTGATVSPSVVNSPIVPDDIFGQLDGTNWTADPLFDVALECQQYELSSVRIPDFNYGDGAFSISFLFKHETAEGSAHEYVFSHGTGVPNIFGPDNLNIYLPEEDNWAHGIMRFVLKATTDADSSYYLDTDGLESTQFQRDVPGHVDMLDGKWHMATIVQTEVGYNVYVDGRLSGIGQGFGAGLVDPVGDLLLCARTDFNAFRHFSGLLNNLRFYDGMLTDKEVYQLYHDMEICDAKEDIKKSASSRTCCLPPSQSVLLGDINSDLAVNVLDVVTGVSYIISTTYLTSCEEYIADFNGDLAIDVLDIVATVGFILNPEP